jgi:MFS family permease
MSDTPTNPNRHILGMIFLTVLMDIIGFAIIIPMFPSLLTHYLHAEGTAGSLVSVMADLAKSIAGTEPRPELVAVLFGGLLSAVFSGLQFVFSPFWGALSDRIGRRPVLVATLCGISFSSFVRLSRGQYRCGFCGCG